MTKTATALAILVIAGCAATPATSPPPTFTTIPAANAPTAPASATAYAPATLLAISAAIAVLLLALMSTYVIKKALQAFAPLTTIANNAIANTIKETR